jgi:hypothetical protein
VVLSAYLSLYLPVKQLHNSSKMPIKSRYLGKKHQKAPKKAYL